MKLSVVGLDHRRAPAGVRESIAFDGPKLAEGLGHFARKFEGSEFVILSTCNRVEIFAAGEAETIPSTGAIINTLAHFHEISAESFEEHLFDEHDEAAVGRLFRVASSLESLVLGEGQILGQVRDAYQVAVREKTVGPILHAVFQSALRVGKRVREETGLDEGKLSIASVAVDLARDIFDTFHDKTVLVIGAGKMADLTLQHLRSLEPGRITIINRSLERAAAAAERWGGKAEPFDRLNLALIEADLVVSTTAAPEPIVSLDQYVRIQRARRHRLALILDIAIPRDFDERIGDLEQVMLYNVDDLQAQTQANRKRRESGIGPATEIIERETAACLATLRHQRHAGVVLRRLGEYADAVRTRELESLYARCPNLTETDRQAIAHTLHRFQNQFLHHPRAALRTAAAEPVEEHPHPLLAAVRRLFGLDDL
ncbi:MAG: glutamyl-tRNA reductase [Isosphaeraceae bacterium]|nr:glutamyl-tRNA reductase [Isosphaeraceae bacterium]